MFLSDDMLGTGGTLIKAMRVLKDAGAGKIICAVSLPFFTTTETVETFQSAYSQGLFHRIIGTNAVFHDDSLLRGNGTQRRRDKPVRADHLPPALQQESQLSPG